MDGKLVDTATGRILLSEIVPPEIPFEIINHVMDKKALGELIDEAYRRLGNKATVCSPTGCAASATSTRRAPASRSASTT